MSIKIEVDIKRSKVIRTPADEAFRRIRTVEEMASYFPNLDQLDKVDEQTYGWVLHKIGNEAYKHRVEYTSCWQWHHEDRKITWEPIKGKGNAQISGFCHVLELDQGSEVIFTVQAVLHIPLPRLVKSIAKPIVKNKFEGVIDTYIDNVIAEMEEGI